MKRPRNLRLALDLLGQSGLAVDAVIEGHRHTRIKLADGRAVIVSRGRSQGEHMAYILARDIKRLLNTSGARS
jgi:hypothetical protein